MESPWPYEKGTLVLDTGSGGTWLVDLGPEAASMSSRVALMVT